MSAGCSGLCVTGVSAPHFASLLSHFPATKPQSSVSMPWKASISIFRTQNLKNKPVYVFEHLSATCHGLHTVQLAVHCSSILLTVRTVTSSLVPEADLIPKQISWLTDSWKVTWAWITTALILELIPYSHMIEVCTCFYGSWWEYIRWLSKASANLLYTRKT